MEKEKAIEALQQDILGPRYKDKRVLMELQKRMPRMSEVEWTCVLLTALEWPDENLS